MTRPLLAASICQPRPPSQTPPPFTTSVRRSARVGSRQWPNRSGAITATRTALMTRATSDAPPGAQASAQRPYPRSSRTTVIVTVNALWKMRQGAVERHVLEAAEHGAKHAERVRGSGQQHHEHQRRHDERSIVGGQPEQRRQRPPQERRHGGETGGDGDADHQPAHHEAAQPVAVAGAVRLGDQPRQDAEDPEVDHPGVAEQFAAREPQAVRPRAEARQDDRHQHDAGDDGQPELRVTEGGHRPRLSACGSCASPHGVGLQVERERRLDAARHTGRGVDGQAHGVAAIGARPGGSSGAPVTTVTWSKPAPARARRSDPGVK